MSKLHENLRPIYELDLFYGEGVIPLIESRGYDCLGWVVVDRATFEQNPECRLHFGDANIYCRKDPDGNYLYKSFNTCYSRSGRAHDQKSVIVFRRGGYKNGRK